jgi:hypothetical protein
MVGVGVDVLQCRGARDEAGDGVLVLPGGRHERVPAPGARRDPHLPADRLPCQVSSHVPGVLEHEQPCCGYMSPSPLPPPPPSPLPPPPSFPSPSPSFPRLSPPFISQPRLLESIQTCTTVSSSICALGFRRNSDPPSPRILTAACCCECLAQLNSFWNSFLSEHPCVLVPPNVCFHVCRR